MTELNVVQLRSDPKLNDIPGHLRAMADRIESGDQKADFILAIVPVDGDWPVIFGWGDPDYSAIELCETAKAWFINNLVQRNT